MTRTNARQLALQLSFAVSAGSDVGPDAFFDEDYFRALPAEDALFTEIPSEKERAYINDLVTGVRDHREELDGIIEQFSQGWKLSRISRTALAVLRTMRTSHSSPTIVPGTNTARSPMRQTPAPSEV